MGRSRGVSQNTAVKEQLRLRRLIGLEAHTPEPAIGVHRSHRVPRPRSLSVVVPKKLPATQPEVSFSHPRSFRSDAAYNTRKWLRTIEYTFAAAQVRPVGRPVPKASPHNIPQQSAQHPAAVRPIGSRGRTLTSRMAETGIRRTPFTTPSVRLRVFCNAHTPFRQLIDHQPIHRSPAARFSGLPSAVDALFRVRTRTRRTNRNSANTSRPAICRSIP